MRMEIFGTLGPADCDTATLTEMFKNGMTGIRLNLSHKNLADCEGWLANYQAAAKAANVVPELLIDMQGPELRTGDIDGEWTIETGEMIALAPASAPDQADACRTVPCPDIIFPYLIPGQRILLNDGTIEAVVCESCYASDAHTAHESRSASDMRVFCRITRGGTLSSRKSIAIPGADIFPPTLTDNDLRNLDAAAKYHVTGIMQPFVRGADDLQNLRKELLVRSLSHVRIFAKIENMAGVRALPELLPYCDHIIIARGDLGNATTLPKLIGIQKDIAALCRQNDKPFMVVTQMLASMEQNPVPTRAEVSDIYNAVLDGASSLMVTGETAIGKYPAETIRYMVEIANEAMQYRACKMR